MGRDLLASAPVSRLALSHRFPLVVQAAVFVLFVYAILDGFFGTQEHLENPLTLWTWLVFAPPLIVLSLALLGRAWCAVCPVGSLADAAGRWSRGLRFPERFRSLWPSVLLYVVALWVLRPMMGIEDSPNHSWLSPAHTAWLLLALTGAAVAMALLYSPRAFCRYVCPIAAPLSVLSRIAPLELRAIRTGKMAAACVSCKGRECLRGSDTVGGCPMGEFPAAMDSNSNCILCLKCVKSCPSRGTIQVRTRAPFSELAHVSRPDVWESLTAVVAVAAFVIVYAIGYEPRIPPVMRDAGAGAHAWLPFLAAEDLTFLIVLTVGTLLMVFLYALACAAAARLSGRGLREVIAFSGYAYVPLVALWVVGYIVAALLGNGGYVVNHASSLLGIHSYSPPALVPWLHTPLPAGTKMSAFTLLLTVPLAAALPLSALVAYRSWRRSVNSRRKALLASAPSVAVMALIVAAYEWILLTA